MEQAKFQKIQDFMQEEFERFAAGSPPALSKYEWPWEKAKWYELVFCLIAKIDNSSAAAAIARETTEIFADLDLLEIDILAPLAPDKGHPDYKAPQLSLMLSILERQGYEEEEGKTAVVSICQAARALQQDFGGKVQKYLRTYGERMLAEAPDTFLFSSMSEEDTRYVFSHWLQNVSNMPVALSHPSVKSLCERFGIGIDELVSIADRLDVSLALLDDWAVEHLERESESES
jgi:DNA repair protein RadC